MMDEVWKREEVESPCVKLCIIHTESGLCMGCYRSGLEISKWSIMTAAERQIIMQELQVELVEFEAKGEQLIKIKQ